MSRSISQLQFDRLIEFGINPFKANRWQRAAALEWAQAEYLTHTGPACFNGGMEANNTNSQANQWDGTCADMRIELEGAFAEGDQWVRTCARVATRHLIRAERALAQGNIPAMQAHLLAADTELPMPS